MGLMKLTNVSVEGRLEQTSVDIHEGEVLGLIGPNGAGKSTLLHAIAGLEEYTGLIEFNGKDLQNYSSQQKAQSIALQPQFVESAWALSVSDVVSLGRLPWGDTNQSIIQQSMQKANVLELANRHVDELSGGEKARVWLARVLANQADVLLVDEPVANLDIHYQRDVMQLLKDYAKTSHAVFIAIHDLSLAAKYCDRVCLLDKGQLIKTGRVEQVLSESILSEVFKVDVYVDLQSEPPVILSK